MMKQFDYQAWAERAHDFIKGFTHSKSFQAEFTQKPPVSSKQIQTIEKRLRKRLPEPVVRFLTEVSSGMQFHYLIFEPPKNIMIKLFGCPCCIQGGASRFLPANNLARYSRKLHTSVNTRWWQEPKICKEYCRTALPIIQTFQGGSVVALDMRSKTRNPKVILITPSTSPRTKIIAANLASFLHHWESLCYVDVFAKGRHFQNSSTGFLDGTSRRAKYLRKTIMKFRR